MKRKNIIDFFTGRIYFSLIGGFRDMFFSECRKKHIALSGVRSDGKYLKADIPVFYKKRLIDAAGISSVSVEIIKETGLPVIIKKNKKRVGIPLGIMLMTLILIHLFSCVWTVEVRGNSTIPTEVIMEELKNSGIYEGAKRKDIDCTKAEDDIENKFSEIFFICINIYGGRIFADIKQTVPPGEITDSSKYSNIVAAKNGEIVKADILEGSGKIYPGNPVVKGDMLVSGVITLKDGSVRFVNSRAEITAKTENTVEVNIPENKKFKKIRKSRNAMYLHVFGADIPLVFYNKGEFAGVSRYYADGRDIIFPVGIVRKNFVIFEEEETVLSKLQIKTFAYACFAEEAAGIYKNTEVKKSRFTEDSSSGFDIKCIYSCVEDICDKKSFTVEEQ